MHSISLRRRADGARRRLVFEPLEERRVLDAADFPGTDELPWHNSVYALDVDNDGTALPRDLLAIIDRINLGGIGPLPVPPPQPVTHFYDTNGSNSLTASDMFRMVTGLLAPPQITVSTLTDFTVDVTPHVIVQAVGTGVATIPDGAVVVLDIDLNDDGDIADPGEQNHSSSTIFAGQATFELSTPLERKAELYSISLRARVKDSNGVMGTSEAATLLVDTLTSDALQNYVDAPDNSYEYELAAPPIPGFEVTPYKHYVLDMVSQTWRSTDDVNLPVWRHWLEVYVPFDVSGEVAELDDSALLFIRGGSNTSGVPQSPDPVLARMATATQSVVANLRIVPNQSVIFTDETQGRSEDEIIAYTLDKFLENIGEPGNETWPLLLPMVKSAVRAMDTIEDFIPTLKPDEEIVDFVISGESKRGWTTWLTAAADDRVRAIMPGVYDNLNIAEQMVNHYGSLGFFSQAVHDYSDMQIFERILTPEALELSRIIDPYRYLAGGRFDDMPKLILNSAGDEFFLTDSSRFYIHDLPGEQNYMRYIPNTGHGLDERAVSSRETFYDAILNDRPLPEFSWTVDQDGTIRVQTETEPLEVRLWQKNNVNARDFRSAFTPGTFWFNPGLATLEDQGGGVYTANVAMPATGATAYFIELTFPNTVPGADPYVFTTEARVKSVLPFHPWPYESGFPE